MGHRERLIDGDEFDALTRDGRRAHRFRSRAPDHEAESYAAGETNWEGVCTRWALIAHPPLAWPKNAEPSHHGET